MSIINIGDAQFLFSALIQVLPTVLSIILLALFALKPERGFFREFRYWIFALIFIFFFSLFFNIIVLIGLSFFNKQFEYIPILAVIFSMMAIAYLLFFLFKYISRINNLLPVINKPSQDTKIRFLIISIILVFIISIIFFFASMLLENKVTFSNSFTLIISIVLAFLALNLAVDSERRMKIIGRSDFLGVVTDYQSSRFNFFTDIDNALSNGKTDRARQILEIATWESVTYLDRAIILGEYAQSSDKEKLIRYLIILTRNVLYFETILRFRHVEHLLISCARVCEFEEIVNFENELVYELRKYIGDRLEREGFRDYINRKLRQTRDNGLDSPFMRFN